MGIWNFRVLKEEVEVLNEKLNRYRVIEVHYDDKGAITGWVDCADTILDWTSENAYEDLKGSAEYVLHAFNKPVVIKDENDKLIEGDNID